MTTQKCSVDDDAYPSFKKSNDTAVDSMEKEEVAGKSTSLNRIRGEVKDLSLNTTPVPAFEFSRIPSSKWTTGAGPRIGCVLDYPANLQSKALEQVNLSPRINSDSAYTLPIPSPRPSPKVRLSPRLAFMGIPSPRVSLTLPTLKIN